MPRFLVGIDLGTTHTVVGFADLTATQSNEPAAIKLFHVEQLIAPGEVAARPLLPSLRYHPADGEIPAKDMTLPWPEPDLGTPTPTAVIGELARELGSRVPGRLVASAKSWLSHRSVDRTEPVLPWGAAEDVGRISPLHASASYLAHVRSAWNHRFPDFPLQAQEIVLTVPASFDEAARTLTVQAASIAGLAKVRLVEEPQAACYDWLSRHRERLDMALKDIRLLLVCDVGGGTTDFTLIHVAGDGKNRPNLVRIGVGDHLMLGGDNMDLALAQVTEMSLVKEGARLTTAALSQLIQQCRSAKERLLASNAPDSASVTVLGTGAKLVRGARSVQLAREEVQQLLVEGFFPRVAADEFPHRLRAGIVEFGLPYAADPAVTRHMAAFLARHAQIARQALGEEGGHQVFPDALLLNGGVFRSTVLSQRLLELLEGWRGAAVQQLDNDSPELAVARGAVAYGLALHRQGVRIGGGSARSYFLTLEAGGEGSQQAVCILPRGAEEGNEMLLPDRIFSLRLGQPVAFHLVSSTDDAEHVAGELVELGPDFTPLPPVAAMLREEAQSSEIPVQVSTVLTEVGTIEMTCIALGDPGRRWNMQFQLRGPAGVSTMVHSEPHPKFGEVVRRIARIYGPKAGDVLLRDARNLRRDMESILGRRELWDMPLLREIFAVLWEGARHRRRSADHERLWFNLAGYCLRPGFGYPLDDWRIQQLWVLRKQGVQYAKDARVWSEWWTLWRRVAGGLDQYAQESLLEDVSQDLLPAAQRVRGSTNLQRRGHDDMVRLAGSLERIGVNSKIEVAGWLLQRLRRPSESAETWWAVGRLGARVPFYGSSHQVVPRDVAAGWLQSLFGLDWKAAGPAPLAATLIARRSGDRELDLEPELRDKVASRLRGAGAPATWIRMVQEIAELDDADEQRIFGESLPPGLRLIH